MLDWILAFYFLTGEGTNDWLPTETFDFEPPEARAYHIWPWPQF